MFINRKQYVYFPQTLYFFALKTLEKKRLNMFSDL